MESFGSFIDHKIEKPLQRIKPLFGAFFRGHQYFYLIFNVLNKPTKYFLGLFCFMTETTYICMTFRGGGFLCTFGPFV
ncbi:hypothetical protein ADIS_1122 [Lunatimonas lonarensis]|uniref:Uncharacterized protein n=1 Tax=Lunatimonas lonarensis TaxID=1232681 RepID=R7ZW86_9BACT|nr:hypothetical protein ADIS_1122 [Lunatimonas lonarensis]